MRFDRKRRLFTFSFRADSSVTEPTELFVPNSQFPDGYRVEVSDGEYESALRGRTARALPQQRQGHAAHDPRHLGTGAPPAELSPYDKLAIVGLDCGAAASTC